MLDYAEPVTKLIDEFKRLPSIGQKSAQRLAFHVMRMPEAEVERLVSAMREVKQRIILCSICNNHTEIDPCRFCSSPTRDHSVICVVEEPHSLVAVSKGSITCCTAASPLFATSGQTTCILPISCPA